MVFHQLHLKNMRKSKWDHLPQIGVKIKKIFELPPPRSLVYLYVYRSNTYCLVLITFLLLTCELITFNHIKLRIVVLAGRISLITFDVDSCEKGLIDTRCFEAKTFIFSNLRYPAAAFLVDFSSYLLRVHLPRTPMTSILKVNPPKTRPKFQSKRGSFGF